MGTSSLFGLAHSLARGNILTFFNTALPGSQKASSLIRLSTSTYRVSRQDSKAQLGINPTEPLLPKISYGTTPFLQKQGNT